jgi:hypothetical protein
VRGPIRCGSPVTVRTGEYFQGRIDDVQVYSRALSVAEIQTDMNAILANVLLAAKRRPAPVTGVP